jgi:hypothetical protein
MASNSLKEIGRLGQKRYGGFFYEEFLKGYTHALFEN